MQVNRKQRWSVFYFGMGNAPSIERSFDFLEEAEEYVVKQLNDPSRHHTQYMILETIFMFKQ